jgi:hypothetical protein
MTRPHLTYWRGIDAAVRRAYNGLPAGVALDVCEDGSIEECQIKRIKIGPQPIRRSRKQVRGRKNGRR